ncbi:MAG TPA: hypothetical protein VIQ03_07095 [Gammaproteobacteria bacterium]
MDLSRIQIKPRIRNTWESIDLGFTMAKSWWRILFLSWFIPALIVYVALSLVFYEDNWLAIIITWWLKPLFDRAPLFVASRKLFNEDVSIRETLRKLPRLYATDFFSWLLWRRLSLTRSFDMPLTILESLKHQQRTKRMHIMHQKTSSAATWLTIVCVHLELVIWMGTLGFFMLLVPEEVDINLMDMIIDESMIAQLVSNSVQFMAMALIAPFYTMAGFALYINRRITLEAWDLEIRFRHLAETYARKSAATVSALVLAVCLAVFSAPQDAYADNYQSLTPEQSSTMINEVLEGSDFHNVVTSKGWRLKDFDIDEADNKGVPGWLISFIKFLESLFGDGSVKTEQSSGYSFANILEVLLWAGIITIVLYLGYRILKFYEIIVPTRSKKSAKPPTPPDILFGLDVRKDSIPKDVTGQTLLLWNNGRHREAIGLLYRSTLSLLIHRFAFQFYDGHTEQECANIVKQGGNAKLSKYVAQLTRSWQQIAYAHEIPLEQQIQLLCNQWNEVSANEK